MHPAGASPLKAAWNKGSSSRASATRTPMSGTRPGSRLGPAQSSAGLPWAGAADNQEMPDNEEHSPQPGSGSTDHWDREQTNHRMSSAGAQGDGAMRYVLSGAFLGAEVCSGDWPPLSPWAASSTRQVNVVAVHGRHFQERSISFLLRIASQISWCAPWKA